MAKWMSCPSRLSRPKFDTSCIASNAAMPEIQISQVYTSQLRLGMTTDESYIVFGYEMTATLDGNG